MASGAGVWLQRGHRRVMPNEHPRFGRSRPVKHAQYRETLQTPGMTARIFNRPKRVCVDHRSASSVTRDQAHRECAHYPTSSGHCNDAFIRHGGIFHPDVVKRKVKVKVKVKTKTAKTWGRSAASRGRHPGPVQRTRRKERALAPSFAMSSGRLFLDRVARQHCPSPLHRQPQTNMYLSKLQNKGDVSTLPAWGHFYFALTQVCTSMAGHVAAK